MSIRDLRIVPYDAITSSKAANQELSDIKIDSARLVAELILAHTIHKYRKYLHAHGDDDIDDLIEHLQAYERELAAKNAA